VADREGVAAAFGGALGGGGRDGSGVLRDRDAPLAPPPGRRGPDGRKRPLRAGRPGDAGRDGSNADPRTRRAEPDGYLRARIRGISLSMSEDSAGLGALTWLKNVEAALVLANWYTAWSMNSSTAAPGDLAA